MSTFITNLPVPNEGADAQAWQKYTMEILQKFDEIVNAKINENVKGKRKIKIKIKILLRWKNKKEIKIEDESNFNGK